MTNQSAFVRSFRFLGFMSFDVIAGAVFSALYVEKIWPTNLNWSVFFVLGGAVWLIYTFDHLYDAQTIEGPAQTLRHQFFQEHFKLIKTAWVFSCFIIVLSLWWLSGPIIKAGLILASLVAMLYGLQVFVFKGRLVVKEIIVAIVYAAALLLGPFASTSFIPGFGWFLFGQFFLLAFANLILFSFNDYERDQIDQQPSLATLFTKEFLRKSAIAIVVFQLLLVVLHSEWISFSWVFVPMGFVLFILAILPAYFAQIGWFRTLGDLVFWFPAVYLLVH